MFRNFLSSRLTLVVVAAFWTLPAFSNTETAAMDFVKDLARGAELGAQLGHQLSVFRSMEPAAEKVSAILSIQTAAREGTQTEVALERTNQILAVLNTDARMTALYQPAELKIIAEELAVDHVNPAMKLLDEYAAGKLFTAAKLPAGVLAKSSQMPHEVARGIQMALDALGVPTTLMTTSAEGGQSVYGTVTAVLRNDDEVRQFVKLLAEKNALLAEFRASPSDIDWVAHYQSVHQKLHSLASDRVKLLEEQQGKLKDMLAQVEGELATAKRDVEHHGKILAGVKANTTAPAAAAAPAGATPIGQ